MTNPSSKGVHLFVPPYQELTEIEVQSHSWHTADLYPGTALVWQIAGRVEAAVSRVVGNRPGGVSLMVVLPAASRLVREPYIWRLVGRHRPHAVLPHHDDLSTEDLSRLLRRPPEDLGSAVTDYMVWRGMKLDPDTVRLVRRTLELSSDLSSVSALARCLYMSRRALGRRFSTKGLPVPSHWLQFGRILRLANAIHNSDESLSTIACSLGFPDGYAASNQMYRLLGLRPSTVRTRFGWEWIVEHWLKREAELGGFAPPDTTNDLEKAPRKREARERDLAGAKG